MTRRGGTPGPLGTGWFGIIAALGLAWPAAVTAETLRTEKTVRFMGFSHDQTQGAWYIEVERHARGKAGPFVDHYALVRIVNAQTNDTLSTYRVGPVERRDPRGRRLRSNDRRVMTDNPPWAQAGPQSDWEALEREFQFEAARISAASALGIVPDPDVELDARAAGSGLVRLDAHSNILGYTLAMADTSKVVLGRYRHTAKVSQHVASLVEALISPRGDYVAIVNRFEIEGTGPTEPSAITYGKIVAITAEARDRGKLVYVRTMWGWKEMTPAQEKIWRKRHQESLDWARMLNAYAEGNL